MNVVNDNAESAVASIQSLNAHLTKSEEQLQYILQIVEKRRELFPRLPECAIREQMRPLNNLYVFLWIRPTGDSTV